MVMSVIGSNSQLQSCIPQRSAALDSGASGAKMSHGFGHDRLPAHEGELAQSSSEETWRRPIWVLAARTY